MWRSADGRTRRPRQMTDLHLQNVICYLGRLYRRRARGAPVLPMLERELARRCTPSAILRNYESVIT
jgi:predicted metal-dependent hydrolase